MKGIDTLFFELIRVAIGTQDCLSRLPSKKEWRAIYEMAKKQSLVGICFAGIQNIGADVDDGFEKIGMPEMLYLKWMGMAAMIQQKNEVVNRQCVALQKKIADDGYRSFIMKGQSVAALYKLHENDNENYNLCGLRQSGDIDVYLEGGLEKVLTYAKSIGETSGVNELEMHVDVFEGTEVEFHYRPFIMRNPFKNRRLQSFFKNQEKACFVNRIALDNGWTICAPTSSFNMVHQMVHIYHHLFTEGIGLRQLLDYYFVLKARNKENDDGDVLRVIHSLGLARFASALMWVIKTVFVDCENTPILTGLEQTGSAQACNVFWGIRLNEKDGQFLLKEIMQSGNFGKQDERQKGLYDSKWNSFWMVNGKAVRLGRFDHGMWFWSPLWRIYHFFWRKLKGFM